MGSSSSGAVAGAVSVAYAADALAHSPCSFHNGLPSSSKATKRVLCSVAPTYMPESRSKARWP